MSVQATAPIPRFLAVCPLGIVRLVPVQKHTLPAFLERGRDGRVYVAPAALEQGWAMLEDLYNSEIKAATPERRAELERGRELLKDYCKRVDSREVLDVMLNPPDAGEAKGVRVIPDWAYPKGVLERRAKTKAASSSFDLPDKPKAEPKAKRTEDDKDKRAS